MKTKMTQIFTIFSFFIFSLSSVIFISWGMNDFLNTDEELVHSNKLKKEIRVKQEDKLEKKVNLLVSKIGGR